jgi:hypothetical protein
VATQRCPKCKSQRIRRGYKPTFILLRMIGIYNLLCDDCNLLFTGFAIPGTVSNRTKKRKETESKSKKRKNKKRLNWSR